MRQSILTFFIIIPFMLMGQNKGNIWCFGDSAGIDFNNINNPVPINTSLDTRGTCVSISDNNGGLLFYAETRAGLAGNTGIIFNRNNVWMQNGDSILGQGWYHEMIIIPDPVADSSYFLFSIGVTTSSLPGLFYSKIAFTINDSLGIVTQKNIQLQSFQQVDCLNAIKHGNGRDWWLIFRKSDCQIMISTNILLPPVAYQIFLFKV